MSGMDTPTVSIITPSFNQADFLEQTLRSVLEQDYPRIECWVMDGGSSDGSSEIIQKYASQLAGWVSEPDQGQADGINKGIKCATGEVIAWLNSDDLYRPGAIASAVQVLQENPQASFVFSDVDSIDSQGGTFNRMHYGDWGLAELMSFHIIGQPGVFMRRSALEQAGLLDTSYHYLLDHHLWLRLAAISEPQYVPGTIWAAARMHEGAKNVAQAAGFGPEAIRLAEWIESDPRFQPLASQMHHKIWAGAYRFNGFYQMEAGKPVQSLKMYWKSFTQHPGTALKDWRRIGYALLSALGFKSARTAFYKARKTRFQDGTNPR